MKSIFCQWLRLGFKEYKKEGVEGPSLNGPAVVLFVPPSPDWL